MLTADLALSWQRGDRIGPRYLDASDETYVRAAEELIALVRDHQGHRRLQLAQALDDYIGIGTDYRILRGLIKLLQDRCTFATVAPVEPAELRNTLFLLARAHHPANASVKEQLLTEAATQAGCAPQEVLDSLYADLPDNQRLLEFAELNAQELLAQYNLAQAQALLYRCVELVLRVKPQAPAGYRQLFEAIKRYRLIHDIRGSADAGYEIRLSGPISLFHRSQKYGIQMAVFLPALLACQGWQLRAEIETKHNKRAFFEMDSQQTQIGAEGWQQLAPDESVREELVRKWAKLGCQWQLFASQEVLDLGAGAVAPDFLVGHPDGRQVYLELLGFWTPRYLTDRLQEFAHSGVENYLFAVSEELRGSREAPVNLPPTVFSYKSALDARALLNAIERLAPLAAE
ncbi:MAG: DUF790 family protein [Acidobacteria bacterium]|nr:DUF790 family protein [Acidobacteriota bacterium]